MFIPFVLPITPTPIWRHSVTIPTQKLQVAIRVIFPIPINMVDLKSYWLPSPFCYTAIFPLTAMTTLCNQTPTIETSAVVGWLNLYQTTNSLSFIFAFS